MFSYAKAAPKSVRLIGSEGQIIVLTAHVPVVLGRGFPVELEDKRCSRKQCTAVYQPEKKVTVHLEAFGVNPICYVENDQPAQYIEKGQSLQIRHGQSFSLLKGSQVFTLDCEGSLDAKSGQTSKPSPPASPVPPVNSHKAAAPVQTQNKPPSPSPSPSPDRPPCKFGPLCYQKNPEHRAKFKHQNENQFQASDLSKKRPTIDSPESAAKKLKYEELDPSPNPHPPQNQHQHQFTKQQLDHENQQQHQQPDKSNNPAKPQQLRPEWQALRGKVKRDQWSTSGSLRYFVAGGDSNRLAGFDLDSTLIKTRSGKVFATGRTDWQWLYPDIPQKLRQLHKEGVKLVIFTNQPQAGVKKDQGKGDTLQGKLDDIRLALGVPFSVFMSTANDSWRKPSTEMWDFCEQVCNGNQVPERALSFYVGDAAGRPGDWRPGAKRDFSASDRKFAANLSVSFFTPEEYFHGEKPAKFFWDGFNPRSIDVRGEVCKGGLKALFRPHQEIILFVGFPGSGKSTFARKHFGDKNYVIASRDVLGSPERCISVAKQALGQGQSVIIDNTSPSPSVRAKYLDLAKSWRVPCRAFNFKASLELAKHLNSVRESSGGKAKVPEVAYATYRSKFKAPSVEEGFSEVLDINFVPSFQSLEEQALFYQWT